MSDIQSAAGQLQCNMLQELQTIFELFASQSTSKTAPGGKYHSKLKFLQDELVALKSNQVFGLMTTTGPTAAQGVTWGIGSFNLSTLPQQPLPQVTPSGGVSYSHDSSADWKVSNLGRVHLKHQGLNGVGDS
jgi:hypothetical protein